MERPSGALATLLLLMTTTACGATTAAMSGGSPHDAARERPPAAASWFCPFPEEADRNGIDTGTVVLWVYVEADGSARSVRERL
ncbi:hypothetical protein BE11_23420 [Sorangium cellulosum]|nr:hypothetical protein BE11_23420 [Sorangium cellulosum]